jgi:asparagine synthetase B (glutamine-hydrolysing)
MTTGRSIAMGVGDPEDDATAFENIRQLEPGHLLIATDSGVELRRWWHPEQLAPLILPSLEQYYAGCSTA